MTLFDHLKTESIARGERNDCAVIAIAAVTGATYAEAHRALAEAGRVSRDGSYPEIMRAALSALGWAVRDLMAWDVTGTASVQYREARDGALADAPDMLLRSPGHVAALVSGQLIDAETRDGFTRIDDFWQIVPAIAG